MSTRQQPYPSTFHLVIIGAGPVGLTASLYAQKLGIDYVLIEKSKFPKDKICGDGLAPLVFNILEELNITPDITNGFYNINEVEFKFSGQDVIPSYAGNKISNSKTFNCKRIWFDDFLKKQGATEKNLLYAEATEINTETNIVQCQNDENQFQIRFKFLLLCTGSGRSVPSTSNENTLENIAFASRAYIQVKDAGRKNFFEFFDEISPGYFWAFPVSETILNTGIYITGKSLTRTLYETHEKKLRQYFQITRPITFRRWPLKIYPNPEKNNCENIVAIGDSNYSIDPLFGHGIDLGMLEAREQINALKITGRFSTASIMYDEIKKLGEASLVAKNILSRTLSPDERKTELQKFLRTTSVFFASARDYLRHQPVQFGNFAEENDTMLIDSENLQNVLTEKGFAILNLLNEKEHLTLVELVGQFQFGFANNLNRGKLKFNSSFFESDTELKNRYYDTMAEFFRPKINSLLNDYDILITNLWDKKPGDAEVLVHQNWSHVDEKHFRSYSIWIPLQKTDDCNGTIEVIPGSHKLFTPLRGINMEHPYSHPFKIIGNDVKKEYMVTIPLTVGQAVIFDDALLHYTGPNKSENDRLAVQLIIKPRAAKGLFYYKHREITNGNNVEVFEADKNFYINLKLITGGNTRPEHGISKGFISHTTEEITMEEFRNIMKLRQQIDLENIETFPKPSLLSKIPVKLKNIFRFIIST